jgi:hypothetical protein
MTRWCTPFRNKPPAEVPSAGWFQLSGRSIGHTAFSWHMVPAALYLALLFGTPPATRCYELFTQMYCLTVSLPFGMTAARR